jgi:hypothetical protein
MELVKNNTQIKIISLESKIFDITSMQANNNFLFIVRLAAKNYNLILIIII